MFIQINLNLAMISHFAWCFLFCLLCEWWSSQLQWQYSYA